MRSKPLFYKQETLYSCVPACLRIVLSGFGLEYSEAELRVLCDCTPFGTEALMVVDAARRLGFNKSAKHTISINELQDLIAAGKYPIAFVNSGPIDGIDSSHALVVVGASSAGITVYDPLLGERILSQETFSAAWAMMHNLAILIEK